MFSLAPCDVYLMCVHFSGSVSDDERLTMYEDFANTFRGEKSLQGCLSEDLKVGNCVLSVLFYFTAQFKLYFVVFPRACRFARIMTSRPSATSFLLFTKRYVLYTLLVSQPVSQSVSQLVSQSASQSVLQSASQSVS